MSGECPNECAGLSFVGFRVLDVDGTGRMGGTDSQAPTGVF